MSEAVSGCVDLRVLSLVLLLMANHCPTDYRFDLSLYY